MKKNILLPMLLGTVLGGIGFMAQGYANPQRDEAQKTLDHLDKATSNSLYSLKGYVVTLAKKNEPFDKEDLALLKAYSEKFCNKLEMKALETGMEYKGYLGGNYIGRFTDSNAESFKSSCKMVKDKLHNK